MQCVRIEPPRKMGKHVKSTALNVNEHRRKIDPPIAHLKPIPIDQLHRPARSIPRAIIRTDIVMHQRLMTNDEPRASFRMDGNLSHDAGLARFSKLQRQARLQFFRVKKFHPSVIVIREDGLKYIAVPRIRFECGERIHGRERFVQAFIAPMTCPIPSILFAQGLQRKARAIFVRGQQLGDMNISTLRQKVVDTHLL